MTRTADWMLEEARRAGVGELDLLKDYPGLSGTISKPPGATWKPTARRSSKPSARTGKRDGVTLFRREFSQTRRRRFRGGSCLLAGSAPDERRPATVAPRPSPPPCSVGLRPSLTEKGIRTRPAPHQNPHHPPQRRFLTEPPLFHFLKNALVAGKWRR